MADQESKKDQKKKVVQIDDAPSSSSSSNTFSNASIESTLTDKSDTDDNIRPDPNPSRSLTTGPPMTHDPTPIPSSIFGSRQATGADWSINSNESLFSITMGNNSFSRDHAFVVYKSGELLRLDEVFSHPGLPPVAASTKAASLCPKRQQDLAVCSAGPVHSVPDKVPAPAVKPIPEEEEQGNNKKQKPDDVGSCGAASEESGASICSFAFPILIKNKEEPTAELPSLQPQRMSSLSAKSPERQPGHSPTPMLSWLSCFFACCPFRRK